MPEPKPITELAMIIILGMILLCILFEGGLVLYGYLNADKVKCNWLWCEFTTERTNITRTISQTCYENGIKINCSNMDDIRNEFMKGINVN